MNPLHLTKLVGTDFSGETLNLKFSRKVGQIFGQNGYFGFGPNPRPSDVVGARPRRGSGKKKMGLTYEKA